MADTQEFLVKLINDWLETSELGSVDACESGEHPGLHGKLEVGGANPLVKAILQRFQQEQERVLFEATKDVDRVELIDGIDRAWVKGSIYGSPVEVRLLSIQDEGRTLKIFVKGKGGKDE